MKTRLLLVLLLIGFFGNASAQEMWSISNSNYSGIMGVALNPSTIVSAPYRYEFNLLAADVFLENNLVYIPSNERLLYRTAAGETIEPQLNFYDASKKNVTVYGRLTGPSFIFNAGKWAAAIHSSMRVEAGLLKVPYSINRFAYPDKNNSLSNTFTTPKFSAAGMAWNETGITFGKGGKVEGGFFKAAATVNYLMAFDGMYLGVNDFSYAMDDSTFALNGLDATYAHAIGNSFAVRGRGMSTTMGATYIRNLKASNGKESSRKPKKYQYRLGFSLLDIGKVHFTSGVQQVSLKSSGGVTWENINSAKFGSMDKMDTALINHLGGTYNNDAFDIWLPMAMSAQFDYPLSAHVYTNLSVINRLHFMPNEIARPNQVAASIRFETRWFETAFNVNLYEYNQPSFGAAIRFLYFTVGTDRLPELTSIADLNSMDIYFGVHFNPLGLSKKGKHTASCPAYKADSQSLAGL